MEMEFTLGLMEINIMEHGRIIKEMEKVLTLLIVVQCILVDGRIARNMADLLIFLQPEMKQNRNGRME